MICLNFYKIEKLKELVEKYNEMVADAVFFGHLYAKACKSD